MTKRMNQEKVYVIGSLVVAVIAAIAMLVFGITTQDVRDMKP